MRKFKLKIVNIVTTSCVIFTISACGSNGSSRVEVSHDHKKPNIIYILADDAGIGDVGAYNPNSKIPTRNIDSLAAHGIKFTDAHTPSSVCTPTRYSILTGRYA